MSPWELLLEVSGWTIDFGNVPRRNRRSGDDAHLYARQTIVVGAQKTRTTPGFDWLVRSGRMRRSHFRLPRGSKVTTVVNPILTRVAESRGVRLTQFDLLQPKT